MFESIKMGWRTARGTQLRQELEDALQRIARLNIQVVYTIQKQLAETFRNIEQRIGPFLKISNEDKLYIAKELHKEARKCVDNDMERAYGLGLLSLFFESSALPGDDAHESHIILKDIITDYCNESSHLFTFEYQMLPKMITDTCTEMSKQFTVHNEMLPKITTLMYYIAKESVFAIFFDPNIAICVDNTYNVYIVGTSLLSVRKDILAHVSFYDLYNYNKNVLIKAKDLCDEGTPINQVVDAYKNLLDMMAREVNEVLQSKITELEKTCTDTNMNLSETKKSINDNHKKYNTQIADLLTGFGININTIDPIVIKDVLDKAYYGKCSTYEACIGIACCFIETLIENNMTVNAIELINKTDDIRQQWGKKGLLPNYVVDKWPQAIDQFIINNDDKPNIELITSKMVISIKESVHDCYIHEIISTSFNRKPSEIEFNRLKLCIHLVALYIVMMIFNIHLKREDGLEGITDRTAAKFFNTFDKLIVKIKDYVKISEEFKEVENFLGPSGGTLHRECSIDLVTLSKILWNFRLTEYKNNFNSCAEVPAQFNRISVIVWKQFAGQDDETGILITCTLLPVSLMAFMLKVEQDVLCLLK